jgi:hypothetical protein
MQAQPVGDGRPPPRPGPGRVRPAPGPIPIRDRRLDRRRSSARCSRLRLDGPRREPDPPLASGPSSWDRLAAIAIVGARATWRSSVRTRRAAFGHAIIGGLAAAALPPSPQRSSSSCPPDAGRLVGPRPRGGSVPARRVGRCYIGRPSPPSSRGQDAKFQKDQGLNPWGHHPDHLRRRRSRRAGVANQSAPDHGPHCSTRHVATIA